MKAGERPDTIHLHNLPTKWFLDRDDRSGIAKDKPSERVLKKVFQTFGDVRAVDIPILDPYRYIRVCICTYFSPISELHIFIYEDSYRTALATYSGRSLAAGRRILSYI